MYEPRPLLERYLSRDDPQHCCSVAPECLTCQAPRSCQLEGSLAKRAVLKDPHDDNHMELLCPLVKAPSRVGRFGLASNLMDGWLALIVRRFLTRV